MLSYFPAPYQGELLYSLISRYGRHTGMGSVYKAGCALFGGPTHRPSFDLPLNLDALVERIPKELELTGDRLIRSHSLFPYFSFYLDVAVAAKVRARFQSNKPFTSAVAYHRLRFGSIRRLRFCPECCHDMMHCHGEMFWRREHQIPWVLVCPEHAKVLRLSTVTGGRGGIWYTAASAASCPTDAEPVLSSVDGSALADLHAIATSATRVLNGVCLPSRDHNAWRREFRALCSRKGLMRNRRQVENSLVVKAVESRFSYLDEALPGCMTFEKHHNWVTALNRELGQRHHPFFKFLAERAVSAMGEADEPFGAGPWPCRNPSADHHGERVIRQSQRSTFTAPRTAVFACSCGWTYLVRAPANNDARSPHECEDLDMVSVDAIKLSCAMGEGIRPIAKKVGVKQKLALAIAQAHGVSGHSRWAAGQKRVRRKPVAEGEPIPG